MDGYGHGRFLVVAVLRPPSLPLLSGLLDLWAVSYIHLHPAICRCTYVASTPNSTSGVRHSLKFV